VEVNAKILVECYRKSEKIRGNDWNLTGNIRENQGVIPEVLVATLTVYFAIILCL